MTAPDQLPSFCATLMSHMGAQVDGSRGRMNFQLPAGGIGPVAGGAAGRCEQQGGDEKGVVEM